MKTIGPFELLDEIGRGAMGVVFRAKDTMGTEIVQVQDFPGNVPSVPAFPEW